MSINLLRCCITATTLVGICNPHLSAFHLSAQNPIVPPGKYCADPSAHQWLPPHGGTEGGPLYVYGSRDEAIDHYCSYHYDVWSTTDMKTWTCHPDVFSSKGTHDEVKYSEELLFAPDCILRDGTYYLYYSQGGERDVEGVATSSSPVGPFKDGTLIRKAEQIDPAAFIDDDGTPYLFFGQFSAKMAILKPNMKEIDVHTLRDSIITEAGHFFHEGIQAIKHGDYYYLVYAYIGRRGMPTCIGYSMSKNIYGPYEHKGVIVDNFGCDPYVWNNHGSIAEFNGQWYVFYHRSTNGSERMRKACVEPIHFNPDGTISEVEMTTQGAAGPLNPFQRMEAERTCYLTGSARISLTSPDNEMLTNIENLNTAAFKYFDFKRQPQRITMCVVPQHGGTIEVYANTLSLPLLATIQVPEGNGNDPILITQDISPITPFPSTADITGIRPIFLRFRGEEGQQLFKLDWFQFE